MQRIARINSSDAHKTVTTHDETSVKREQTGDQDKIMKTNYISLILIEFL